MSLAQKVNVLRASVMGANDGIISVAGIVIGVAAATSNPYSILISGLSGSLAGTISMCMGEYVSVSTQKDSQKMALISERQRLTDQYQRSLITSSSNTRSRISTPSWPTRPPEN